MKAPAGMKADGPCGAGTINKSLRKADRVDAPLHCPVCETRRAEFVDFNGRRKVKCSHCGSLERHRAVWRYFKDHTDLFREPERRFLHIAPEACFIDKFLSFFGPRYLTADLNMQAVMVRMDIMDMPYAEASFEILYCSHVLEHVENYHLALKELYRVLKSGGWMVLLIPSRNENETFRFAEPSPSGHIWKFGCDFGDVLEGIGLKFQVRSVQELFSCKQIQSMKLKKRQEIFHCVK